MLLCSVQLGHSPYICFVFRIRLVKVSDDRLVIQAVVMV